MPWSSDKQRRWGHTAAAKAKGFTEAKVNEFDSASKGMNLPEAAVKRTAHKASRKGKFAKKKQGLPFRTAARSVIGASNRGPPTVQPNANFRMPHQIMSMKP